MPRSDRLLGILLQLSDGRTSSATELARRFEVSVRTIYRDIDTLGELGVPVYAEPGRGGGYRLLDGYFLPPVMLSTSEAVSLVLGLALARSIRSRPFAGALETAESKLLAALPPQLRQSLRDAPNLIGFEGVAPDAFHSERVSTEAPADGDEAVERERAAVDTYLSAILERKGLILRYRSPYRPGGPREQEVQPLGMFWDRNLWYLAGRVLDDDGNIRIWRADRVLDLRPLPGPPGSESCPFDIRDYLGRNWLAGAMEDWASSHPVRILLTPEQVSRLQGDWYYRHARYEAQPDGRTLMTFGQDRPEIVTELLRWLGPGAELLEPARWRECLKAELHAILSAYE